MQNLRQDLLDYLSSFNSLEELNKLTTAQLEFTYKTIKGECLSNDRFKSYEL